jgi:hypothetical protein
MPDSRELTLIEGEDAVHLYWDDAHGYLLAEWQPVFCRGEKLKRGYEAILRATRARPGVPWLVDSSQLPVIDPADMDWITRWYFPELIRAGARYQAHVRPNEEVVKVSTRKAVVGVVKPGVFEMTAHRTRAEAEAAILAWLEKRKEA